MYEKFNSLFTLALFNLPAFSQEGVNFEHIIFDEALAKAENKLVLMIITPLGVDHVK